jgi:hypothetical protein
MSRASALAFVVATMLAVPSSAVANTTTPTSKKVVGATATVSSCGSLSAMTISWTVTANVVTSIALGSIPSACNGGSLSMTLVDASNASLGAVDPVTISGTSMTLTPTGSPTATSVATSYVSVVGP